MKMEKQSMNCENCGSQLTSSTIRLANGDWEETTIECLKCEKHFEVIN
jgi:transcription elongation factor Elf1